ncbi:MAG: hypothetical protein R2748_30580 [Bryobacterales bacterium]
MPRGLAGALRPINFWAETKGSFETPLAGVMLLLVAIVSGWRWRNPVHTVWWGLLLGLTILTTSAAALVVAALLAVEAVQRPRAALLCGGRCSCRRSVAIRNELTLGSMVWTAPTSDSSSICQNNDAARADYQENLEVIYANHPHASAQERAKLIAMGEVAYHAARLQSAKRWIMANPGRFIRLTAERIWLFWFPGRCRPYQTFLFRTPTALALVGLAVWIATGQAATLGVRGLFLTFLPVYYLVHSLLMYRSPMDWSLWFLADILRLPPHPAFGFRAVAIIVTIGQAIACERIKKRQRR